MKPCKYEHEGRCCNAGCIYFRAECKQPCYALQTLTNYERIKSMTVEEMAEMLFNEANNSYNYCDYCPNQRYYAPHCAADDIETGCKNAIMQWLNEESEVKGNDAEYSERCDSSFGGKEYAKQMRENAVIDNNGNVIVSEELWRQIANIIETQQAEIERLESLVKTQGIEIDELNNFANERLDKFTERYDRNLRAEAIRDFADSFDDELAKLRDTYFERGMKDYSLVCEVIHDYLYRTLKEMVGAEQ